MSFFKPIKILVAAFVQLDNSNCIMKWFIKCLQKISKYEMQTRSMWLVQKLNAKFGGSVLPPAPMGIGDMDLFDQ